MTPVEHFNQVQVQIMNLYWIISRQWCIVTFFPPKIGGIYSTSAISDFSKKNIFLSVVWPTQLYFLSVLPIIGLSCVFKVNNKPKIPAGPRTDNQGFMTVLHKICLSEPVGPTILEMSVIWFIYVKLGGFWKRSKMIHLYLYPDIYHYLNFDMVTFVIAGDIKHWWEHLWKTI